MAQNLAICGVVIDDEHTQVANAYKFLAALDDVQLFFELGRKPKR